MLEAYSKNGLVKVGPIRAYRNDLYVFPTQTLIKADQTITNGVCTVTAVFSNTRTFWQQLDQDMGTYPSTITTTTNDTATNTVANSATWVAC